MKVLGMIYKCDRCKYTTCAPAIFGGTGGDELQFDKSGVDGWYIHKHKDLCPTCYKQSMEEMHEQLLKFSGKNC